MTKANDNARAAVADAERRARQKMKRLQKKGIRTGSISPFREVDLADTRAAKKYARELEGFVSRSTRFIAGRDGTPIPYSAYRDYKRIERQWNKEHMRYWEKFAEHPYITAYGASDMTLGQRSAMGHVKGLPFGDIGYQRSLDPESIRSVADLEKRKKILQREMSPSFQKKRVKELRKNLMAHVETFNDPQLPSMIRKLSDEQLFALQNFTNFVPLYYRYLSTNVEVTLGPDIDAMEHDAQVEHMKMTIEQIKKSAPLAVKEWATKGRKTKSGARKGKRSKASVKVYAPTKEAAKEKAHRLYEELHSPQ